MNYSRFVLLGTGNLVIQCGEYLKKYEIPIIVFDTNSTASTYVQKNCEKNGLDYRFVSKQALFAFLTATTDHTLIVSAYNPYIIPAYVLDKPNIRAVNVHHALLPAHPGRNAEAWAIYDMDEYSGITWHILSEKVDKGAIIAQERIKLDDKITSIKLLALQNKKALTCFQEFIDDFLHNACILTPQQTENRKITHHYAKDLPNDGVLDLNWPAKKISAFLRAYDYGVYRSLGTPRLVYEGQPYQWQTYSITGCEPCDKTICVQERTMILKEGSTEIRLTQLSRLG